MQSNPINRHFITGLSRKGKLFVAVMIPVLCAEAALAYRQITAYDANPCKSEAAGLFSSTGGGCKDARTGRVWSRNTGSAERGGTMCTFTYGKAYCDNLVEGGMTDWRLPTRDELKAAAANGAGIYVDAFRQWDGTEFDMYKWSSTTYKGGHYAYAVTLAAGSEGGRWATDGSSWTDVVCVR